MKNIKSFFRFVFVYRPLREVQAHATKFQVFTFWCRNGLRRVVILAMFAVFSATSALVYREINPKHVFADKLVDTSETMFETKIENLKHEVLNQLSKCESAGYKEDDGLIVFDSNAKASIGNFQWQVASVIHYMKVLKGKDVTRKEAILIALDKDSAGELAKMVMFETKNMAGKDWYNCNNKYNLDEQIKLIKKLEL